MSSPPVCAEGVLIAGYEASSHKLQEGCAPSPAQMRARLSPLAAARSRSGRGAPRHGSAPASKSRDFFRRRRRRQRLDPIRLESQRDPAAEPRHVPRPTNPPALSKDFDPQPPIPHTHRRTGRSGPGPTFEEMVLVYSEPARAVASPGRRRGCSGPAAGNRRAPRGRPPPGRPLRAHRPAVIGRASADGRSTSRAFRPGSAA